MSTWLRGSYLTTAEYRAVPTALSTTNLVPGGSQDDQDEQLASIIARASRWLDNVARQQLYATQSRQRERVRTNEQGFFVLHPRDDRAKSVDAFAWGATPTGLSAITPPIPPSAYFVEENRILLNPAATGGLSWVGSLNFLAQPRNAEVYVDWIYTAGWVTTVLAEPAAAAATSVTVLDPSGIQAGLQVRLINASDQEHVTVADTYVPGSVVVPLTVPLVEAWPPGAGFTEVPDDLKEAAILATNHFVKLRKAGGFVMGGATATVDQATDLQLGPEMEAAHKIALRYERKTP